METKTPAKQGASDKIVEICKNAAGVDVHNELVLSEQKTVEHHLTVSAVWGIQGRWKSQTRASTGGTNYFASNGACEQAADNYINFRGEGEYDRLMQITVNKANDINGGLSTSSQDELEIEHRKYIHTDGCPSCNTHGSVTCTSCSGRGQYTCSGCGGNGRQNCSGCGGSGGKYVLNPYTKLQSWEHCYGCGGGGKMNCYGCGGRGHHTCTSCAGRGRVTCGRCDGNGYETTTYSATITAVKRISVEYVPHSDTSKWHIDAMNLRRGWIQNTANEQQAEFVYENNKAIFKTSFTLPFHEIDAKLRSWSGRIQSIGMSGLVIHSYANMGSVFLEHPTEQYLNAPNTEAFKTLVKQPTVKSVLQSRHTTGESWLTRDSFVDANLISKLHGIYQSKLKEFKDTSIRMPILPWLGFGVAYALLAWVIVSAGVAAHDTKEMSWVYLGLSGPILGKMDYLRWILTSIYAGVLDDFFLIVDYIKGLPAAHDSTFANHAEFASLTFVLAMGFFILIYFWVRKYLGRAVDKPHGFRWKFSVTLVTFLALYALYPVLPDWSYVLNDPHYFQAWIDSFKGGGILLPEFLIIGFVMSTMRGRHNFIKGHLKEIKSYDIPEINEDLKI